MKKIGFLLLAACPMAFLHAQDSTRTLLDVQAIHQTPSKSGLSYDALTSFLQANLSTGNSGGYDMKATLFAIQKVFSADSLNASSIYLQRKAQRNLEFALGIHKGAGGDYNILTAAIKYALINRRDKSEVNFAGFDNGALLKEEVLETKARHEAIRAYETKIDAESAAAKAKDQEEMEQADKKYHKSHDFSDYPDGVQDFYHAYLKTHHADQKNYFKTIQDHYDEIAKQIDLRGLLTIGFNPGYDWNHSRFDSTTLNMQYLKGFGNFTKPWSVDLKATAQFQHDSTSSSRSLGRHVYIAAAGINKVLLYDSKLNPILELELAYEDDYIGGGLYAKESRNQPKIVNIFRVHITKDISLPLTLKYDLKKPNLLGIFRVQWDLQGGKKS